MTYKKIPNEIRMGGQTIKIVKVERCDNNTVGEMCLAGSYIEIAERFSKDEYQEETSKTNTFYHEVTHAILDMMGEKELSGNEKFVCCFSSFLADAMDKAVFEVGEISVDAARNIGGIPGREL